MTREEYEERKRRLDEQLHAGIELLEAAHRQQVRALELVWMATAEESPALPRRARDAPAAIPHAVPGTPQRPLRRAAWQLLGDVQAILAGVPEVFDRNHVCDALGYEPDRGSLYRTLQVLVEDGVLGIESAGEGRTPTQYRKTGAGVSRAGM
jgi:hypothetical protein